MTNGDLLALGWLAMTAWAQGAPAADFPSELNLPQTCKYSPPHEDFGTVSIVRNDDSSIRVTGLEGVEGAVVLSYRGSYQSPNGRVDVFLRDGSVLPPEVKLLENGGDTVFYGDTWGYDVHCEVNRD